MNDAPGQGGADPDGHGTRGADGAAPTDGARATDGTARSRPLVERLLLLLVALALATGFFVMGAASWASGEPALGVFGVIGGVMTLWVGGLTLRRG